MEEKHSRLGIASFVISIAVGCAMLLLFIIGGILSAGRFQHGQDYPGQVLVGITAILLLAADIVAVGLGVAALLQPATKRIFGILGLTFSSLTVGGSVLLIVIGLLYANKVSH